MVLCYFRVALQYLTASANWPQDKALPFFLIFLCKLGCDPIVSFCPRTNSTEICLKTKFLQILEWVTGLGKNARLLQEEAEWPCFYLISWPDFLWPWIIGWTSPDVGKVCIWVSWSQFPRDIRQLTPPKLLSSLKQFRLSHTIFYILHV